MQGFIQRRKGILTRSGFTLIEMLIVIIILGILAMIIVPQITVSSEDAKVSTLKTNLSTVRSAIETYYVQHDNNYPGNATQAGGGGVTVNDNADAFEYQLTRYTTKNGTVSNTKNSTVYGPYLKGGELPKNPFTETSTVDVDISTSDITTRSADGSTAWRFYLQTGVFIANDGGSTDGTAHESY